MWPKALEDICRPLVYEPRVAGITHRMARSISFNLKRSLKEARAHVPAHPRPTTMCTAGSPARISAWACGKAQRHSLAVDTVSSQGVQDWEQVFPRAQSSQCPSFPHSSTAPSSLENEKSH